MVVTLIIAILLGLIVPWLHGARIAANRVSCRNNLKVIASGLQSYLTQYNSFLPVNRERTDGTWYSGIVLTGAETGYSWQQILDKLMDASNQEGFVYTTGEYMIVESGEQRLINLRGHHPAFKCPVTGYGKGTYVGSYTVFKERYLPSAAAVRAGPISIGRITENRGQLGRIPIVADGSQAQSDESWIQRFGQREKLLDPDGDPTPEDTIHASVTGRFIFTPEAGPDAANDFITLDFRHGGKANVLFLDWKVEEWDRPVGEDDPEVLADPNSAYNEYWGTWDSMFYRIDYGN